MVGTEMKVTLKLLGALLLFLILSSQKSLSSYDNIGIIYINRDNTYSLVFKPIDISCDIWWEQNLVISERENPQEHENVYQHTIAGNEVIGHICNPTLTD